jgi:peptidoglycan/LPS O-acetylase OafA/YrhL
MILLGEASYAMYILHMPLRFWWGWITRQKLHADMPWLLDLGLFLCLVIIVSIVALRYVEQPLRRRILGHPSHRDGRP